MTTTAPTLTPLGHEEAERIARAAVMPGCRTMVGARVVAALLDHIEQLAAERATLRAELDRREALELEQARLRAHAMAVKW
jgi:hypothetical protein